MKSFYGLWAGLLLFSFVLTSVSQARTIDGEFISKCFGCHGRKGVSGYSEFPNLAGQDKDYIFNQLKAFRDGKREDLTLEAMPYMVHDLSDQDLTGLADIFNRYPKEKVKRAEMSERDEEFFNRGKEIIAGNTTTCRFCHLANPTKDGPATPGYPSLTGQQKGYLMNQIKAFKEKKRWNPIMNSDLIGNMSDEDIEAVATYMRYLRVEQ